jgi:hypothetical protein
MGVFEKAGISLKKEIPAHYAINTKAEMATKSGERSPYSGRMISSSDPSTRLIDLLPIPTPKPNCYPGPSAEQPR